MIKEHEDIISNIIFQRPIQKTLFNDFMGKLKVWVHGEEILYLPQEMSKHQNISLKRVLKQ